MQHRLNFLARRSEIVEIVVRTSQLTHEFYAKFGFKLEQIERDYWAEGFDLYAMRRANAT